MSSKKSVERAFGGVLIEKYFPRQGANFVWYKGNGTYFRY